MLFYSNVIPANCISKIKIINDVLILLHLHLKMIFNRILLLASTYMKCQKYQAHCLITVQNEFFNMSLVPVLIHFKENY